MSVSRVPLTASRRLLLGLRLERQAARHGWQGSAGIAFHRSGFHRPRRFSWRRRFLEELGNHSEFRRLYDAAHEHERVAMDARRARRETEWPEGAAE